MIISQNFHNKISNRNSQMMCTYRVVGGSIANKDDTSKIKSMVILGNVKFQTLTKRQPWGI